MKTISLLRLVLYIGAISIIFFVTISFNSLRVVSTDGKNTIRKMQAHYLLEELESQIIDTTILYSRETSFNRRTAIKIDDQLIKLEQQIAILKLPSMDKVKQYWDQIKYQKLRDPSNMIRELTILRMTINKNAMEDIRKQVVIAEKDISGLSRMKIVISLLVILLLAIEFYVDTLQKKEKFELLSIDKENTALKNLTHTIGHEGMNKIVQSYLAELPKIEASINKLIDEKNLEELHKLGHRCKSSSQSVGANELANLFKELEETPQLGDALVINTKINSEVKMALKNLNEQINL